MLFAATVEYGSIAAHLAMVAFFIGGLLMLVGGTLLFVLIFAAISEQILARTLRWFGVYQEFLAFAIPRVRAKAEKRRRERRGS